MARQSSLSGRAWDSRSAFERARSDPTGLGALVLAVLGTLFVLYLLAVWFDWLPDLRGWGNYPQGWTWATYPLPPLERFLPVVAIMIAMWVVVALVETSINSHRFADSRRSGTVRAAYLLMMVLLGYGLQLSFLNLKADNGNGLLMQRVTNRVITSYFNLAASSQDASAFFVDYPAVFNTTICPHCHDHPPGPALYYWLNIQAVQTLPQAWRATLAGGIKDLLGYDPAVIQVEYTYTNSQFLGAFMGGSLVLLLAAAVVVPLYGLARHLGPPGWEFRLAALGVVMPGVVLMAPQFDQAFATLTASVLYICVRGLLADDPQSIFLWGVGGGLLVAVGIYFSWSLASLLLVAVALGLACVFFSRSALVSEELSDPRFTPGELMSWVAGLALGVGIPLLFVTVAGQTDLAYILNYNLSNAARAEAQRPYSVWVFRGPLDFLQFLGLPLAAAAAWALAIPTRRRQPAPVALGENAPAGVRAAFRVPWYERVNPYGWLLWGAVVAIDLSGRSKAEQGRLLIFLMPVALAAIYLWAGRARFPAWLISILFFAEMAACFVIGARWLL